MIGGHRGPDHDGSPVRIRRRAASLYLLIASAVLVA